MFRFRGPSARLHIKSDKIFRTPEIILMNRLGRIDMSSVCHRFESTEPVRSEENQSSQSESKEEKEEKLCRLFQQKNDVWSVNIYL